MIHIRPAVADDAPALLDIYAPYVIETAITFEYEVPTLDDFRQRIKNTLHTHPYLVIERDGEIVGYAYTTSLTPGTTWSGWKNACPMPPFRPPWYPFLLL